MYRDRFGQLVTVASARAGELYDAAVDRLFALQPGDGALIDQALAVDGDFALAHCVKARSLLLAGETAEARRHARRGRDLAAALPARERRHADVVCKAVLGESAAALRGVREHAAEYPRDAVPLSLALGVYGLLGFGGFDDFHAQQLALLDDVAGAWGQGGEDWWFLASRGWACVEAGRAAAGIAMLDRALELNPANANAVHGRVHGYYEQGAVADGEAFIDAWLPSYSRDAALHGHLAWHQALFALQRGDAPRAASIYRDSISPRVSRALAMFTMIDCASLVMRGLLYGQPLDAEDRRQLAAFVEQRFPRPGIPFANVHIAMAYAGAGEHAALTALEHRLARLTDGHGHPAEPVTARLCTAVTAYAAGRYEAAAEQLTAALPELERLGGSHAQRDVWIDLLISAHLRGGAHDQARAVAARRWARRAVHLDEDWLTRLGAG